MSNSLEVETERIALRFLVRSRAKFIRSGIMPSADAMAKSLSRVMIASHLEGETERKKKVLTLASIRTILRRVKQISPIQVEQYEDIAVTVTTKLFRDMEFAARDLVSPTRSRLAEIYAQFGGQVKTVYRTQQAVAFSAGQWVADQDPDISEILWGYKYVTVGDDFVRPNHVAMDGTTLPKDDPFWQDNWTPNGWNCRCDIIPIFTKTRTKKPAEGGEADPGWVGNVGVLIKG